MSVSLAAQRAAHTRWCRRRRKLIAMGQWQPFVDAEPVRERIRAINKAGMPTRVLAEKLNLSPTALEHVMWKRHGVASQQVRRETADAVMSYWPSLDDLPGHCLVDSTGTRRRVNALYALGWTRRALSARSGVAERSLSRALLKPRVTADFARTICAVYDELWKRSPYPTEVAETVARQTRRKAKEEGLVGPLAWDDDTIDDPAALPQTDAAEPVASEGGNVAARWLMGESVVLDGESRKEVVAHFYEWTELSTEEIAAKVGMNPDAVDQMWNRIKKRARMEGRPVPRRRVYAYRDKDLTKNEMGAAA
ncbi:hypothetical protein [Streptomyces rochei]|uniref:hypothetical protein n=1 Tax=Streptomyces rochei TaxID=1928 RepID=UPI003695FE28